MRFNAWKQFFSVHMEENESLSSLMTRIDAAMVKVKNLRPASFSLDDLDKELVSMTMIRSLPAHYSGFASSLTLLDKLDKDTLQAAFINEEALRSRSSTCGSVPSKVVTRRQSSLAVRAGSISETLLYRMFLQHRSPRQAESASSCPRATSSGKTCVSRATSARLTMQ